MNASGPNRFSLTTLTVGLVLAVVALLCFASCKTVPAGHVSVATLFGEVKSNSYGEGIHFPVNPLYSWHDYDTRQKTHMETADVPSQDQLTTSIDVSVQFRINRAMAPQILQETGSAQEAVDVHLIPTLRSVIREQGKSIERAEDFFQDQVQDQLQRALLSSLQSTLQPMGIEVQAVLLRDMRLPPFILQAIEQKKEREQAAQRQEAELERFRTEQQQLFAQAEAEQQAAELEAQRIRMLAEARAYEIEVVNTAAAGNAAYIQLQSLSTLETMSANPAVQLYFMNGDSPTPLPLMNVGAAAAGAR